jgi:prepilin peptidase CpaA
VALLACAAWFDVRVRRIPNALTVTGLVVALALRALVGPDALLAGVAGAGLALLVALPPFALRALGGGDVKLLAAVGGFMGPGLLPGALLVIAVLGGALALCEAARRRVLIRTLANTYGFAKQWASFGRFGITPAISSPRTLTIPYGVAIAVGSLVWWLWEGAGL